ncbi:hypothetical protein [Taurinivorans muris]|jgi:hypothetical protein
MKNNRADGSKTDPLNMGKSGEKKTARLIFKPVSSSFIFKTR